jgi:hypothetical protein
MIAGPICYRDRLKQTAQTLSDSFTLLSSQNRWQKSTLVETNQNPINKNDPLLIQ